MYCPADCMYDETLTQLNRAWNSTCKILLGTDELGDLLEFKDYLKRNTIAMDIRKSALSGQSVTLSSKFIQANARVIGYSEMGEYEKKLASLPLNINEIKDIDSLIAASRERVYYAGNIVLGNSRNVLDSHRCMNTSFALSCLDVYDGKYVAYTTSIRNPQYVFGCSFGGDLQFCIKVLDPYAQVRCMETFRTYNSSDCYYCAAIEDSTNCLFSFNQKNKHNLIGNVQLTKDEYAKLKTKLIGEIATNLKKNKTLPSILDIISGKDVN